MKVPGLKLAVSVAVSIFSGQSLRMHGKRQQSLQCLNHHQLLLPSDSDMWRWKYGYIQGIGAECWQTPAGYCCILPHQASKESLGEIFPKILLMENISPKLGCVRQ
jgi:hypothetical protein